MNETRQRILDRVRAHYSFLCEQGYEVMFTALQGSQNYGLDIYTDDYCSDVDTKSIVLPTLDDFIWNHAPVSTIRIMPDSEEHAEVKDIRVMFEMFRKENLSYIELLYSDYVIINPKYAQIVDELIQRRDEIATADTAQFLKCIAGMAYEKDKALCHPYPGIIDKIEKYGYDGKQLSHCYRLMIFLEDFTINGKSIAECYKPAQNKKELMMYYKKQLNEQGNPLSKERAVALSAFYSKMIKYLKDEAIAENDYGVNTRVWEFLNELQARAMKQYILEYINAQNL